MPDSDDPRERLVLLVVRLRAASDSERSAIVEQLLPLFRENSIPVAVRMAAAARAIESLPDTADAISGVVRAVTAGIPPSRGLERLRHLQNLTEKADSLDAIIAQRERKVKMSCPRCGVRLSREEMAKHLWHEHRLTLVNGKTRSRGRAVDAIRRAYAAVGDPALFDHAADVGGEAAVRVWTAETASEEESLMLCRAARERGAGLCPECFGEVSPRVPELPPLAVAHGRVAGDGYAARAGSVLSPRMSATLAAAFVLLTLGGCVHFVLGVILATITYGFILYLFTPRSSPDDDAIDAAWRKLVHRLADRNDAARFLARLCLTSIGRGDPMERANTLIRIISRARANPAELELLAMALTLQMDDSGRFGRDRAAGIAELVAPAFRGEHPTDYAEFVLGAYFRVPRETTERERLRILLHASAFAAGLLPRDIIELCDAAPHVAEAMRLAPHHLAMLYGVWTHRTARAWAPVGEAKTVFELTATARTTAGKLLTNESGLLLMCETPPDVETELGPVLITASGVSVGGAVTLDPASDVRIESGGRELIFGKHMLKLSRVLPAKFADKLKAWLRFRAEVLAVYPAMYLRSESRPQPRVLAPFAVRCPACGAECLPVVGAVGREVRS
jgi:predicted RNA-binding Zn-ribbon protein involved in translation (DUF1610 family)